MEAEDQNLLKTKDERDFFALIEKKMEQQGFQVLETLPPEGNGLRKPHANYPLRPAGHIAY
jgi:hypothetical protein